jgi:hypothetical protein
MRLKHNRVVRTQAMCGPKSPREICLLQPDCRSAGKLKGLGGVGDMICLPGRKSGMTPSQRVMKKVGGIPESTG